jgi:membrane-associated phospholipid phosphatase
MKPANLPFNLVLLFLLFFISIFFFGYIVHEVIHEKETHFDERVLNYLSGHTRQGMIRVMEFISWLGTFTAMFIAYLILVIWLLVKNKKGRALFVAVVALSSSGLLFLLKDIYQRLRPSDQLTEAAYNYGFPSGHAALPFILYGIVIYMIWKTSVPRPLKYTISVFLFLLSIFIGFSRIYLRKHYPSDVIAGFCIGIAYLTIAIWLMRRSYNHQAASS